MYGLINRAIEELVRSSGGPALWNQVRASSGIDIDYFEGMVVYDDSITMRLLEEAATVLETSRDELLERFGRYWIVYTSAEGWGPILDDHGNSVLEVLQALNALHRRIRTSMPDLRPPHFVVAHHDEHRIDVQYHSERDGLAPMVTGLLRGLAERFEEDWHVAHVGTRAQDGFDSYLLSTRIPANRTPVGVASGEGAAR